jgi:hypothetical protein
VCSRKEEDLLVDLLETFKNLKRTGLGIYKHRC